jgi:hypothetical protein
MTPLSSRLAKLEVQLASRATREAVREPDAIVASKLAGILNGNDPCSRRIEELLASAAMRRDIDLYV